jgi:hypothetical protein
MPWQHRLLGLFWRALGLEPGQTPEYYANILLGIGFAFASLFGLVFLLSSSLVHPAFWVASVFALVCLLLSKYRLAMLAAVLLVVAIRFAIAFIISPRPTSFVAAVVLAASAVLIIKSLPPSNGH